MHRPPPTRLHDLLPPAPSPAAAVPPSPHRLTHRLTRRLAPALAPVLAKPAWARAACMLLVNRLVGAGPGPAPAAGATCDEWVTACAARPDADIAWQARDEVSGLAAGMDEQGLWFQVDVAGVDREWVEQFLQLWESVLAQMLAAPQQSVSAITIVAADDLQGQHVAWQGGPWTWAGSRSLTRCLAEAAQADPQAPALAWNDGTLDYATLERDAQALAQRLAAAGVRCGDRVALALRRGPGAVLAMLATLRCGAAYVPLDEAYPPARLAAMLADAGACIALVDGSAAFTLPDGLPTLALQGPPAPAQALPAIDDSGERIAYVMYTSGSTGEPKGVQVPERAIVRLVRHCNFMTLDARTVMLQAAPLGFDASTLEIWGPLLNGSRCVLHDETVPTSAGLRATLARHGVTSAWLTATLFNAVVDDDAGALAGLQELLTGGEALSVRHIVRAQQALPQLVLVNGYGPTETTTFAATYRIPAGFDATQRAVPIGRAVNATTLAVLNERQEPLPAGMVGELWIGGLGVASGYLGREASGADGFAPDPAGPPGALHYRTGDRVRWRADGQLDFIGRADGQLKLRGYRIETREIETRLTAHASVKACAVIGIDDAERGGELVAYVVPRGEATPAEWHRHLAATLPGFMLPTRWVTLDALPRNANGKLDRRALQAPPRVRPAHLQQAYVEPATGTEREIAAAFAQVLGLDRVGALDGFFDLGGHSLLALRLLAQLQAAGHGALTVAHLFQAPTPRGLGGLLQAPSAAPVSAPASTPVQRSSEPVAIIGMAVRLPGAPSLDAFWELLREGRDGIRVFSADELDASIPAALRADPAYVAARGVIDEVESFDAGFFGMTALEAELTDPQHRVFLELCWHCLEHAGQVPEKTAHAIGVFAGMYNATYFQRHLQAHPEAVARLGDFAVMLANEKDYLTSRVAHKLGLTGPAVAVNTACSTSLVALAQAVESLLSGQCGMALAGGVAVTCPPRSGHLHEDGSMLSPDGRTRPFDAAAQGTVFSDGAAVLLLKRLTDAIADGNTIHAVIRGVAVNNDGARRASFTAPSVEGQAAVVASALDRAGVSAADIDYVEAHGTATPLGDPVEVAALRLAFERQPAGPWVPGRCAIGSVKSNIGHTVMAAGAAGLVKVALSLTHEWRPGTAHFQSPNPRIDFEGGPFRVQGSAEAWPRGERVRRAGVSAFGVGGTNAHAVVEEAPLQPASAAAAGPQCLKLSARTPAALAAACRQLASHVQGRPELNLADVAFTLDQGRRDFACRMAVAVDGGVGASGHPELVAALNAAAERPVPAIDAVPAVVFAFPGQGSQYGGMGLDCAAAHPGFASAFDQALAAMQPHVALDLRAALADGAALEPTAIAQPLTFCIEVALARALIAAGVEPDALVGHSVGEFAAAVIAGVMELDDAAWLVAQRGALMQALPPGAMRSVRLPAAQLAARLPADLQLAADNAPQACVVSGPAAAVERFAALLEQDGIATRALRTSHAFHSAMMDAAVAPFEALLRGVTLSPPRRRIVSTLSGQWLRDDEATDPRYWARHLRETVRFGAAVATLLADDPQRVFIETGPRSALGALIRQQGATRVVATLGDEPAQEARHWAASLGALWALGLPVRSAASSGRRVPLPTYAFQRQRHWLEALPAAAPAQPAVAHPTAEAAPTPRATVDRRAALIERLKRLFEEVSGADLADVDPGVPFVALGLDSLTLTQVALKLKRSLALPVSFRQLMETQSSFDSLAAYAEERLPAAPLGAPPAPAVGEAAALAHRTYDVKKAFGAIARIHTGGAEISARQRTRLDAFTRRYIDKTARSKQFTAAQRPHMADPRVVNGFRPQLKEIIYPIVIERSAGARVWDLDGNEYVDALNGFGMSLFGWQPGFVVDAVRQQLDTGYEIGPQHPLAGDVTRLICEFTGFERAALCNTGSEAVMGCVRIARTVTGRDRIALFSGAYHGIFDEVIVRGTKTLKAVPAAPGILPNTAENVVVLDYGTPESLQWLKDNAHDLAAVLVEPVQSRRPDFQPREFLRDLRRVTQDAGALLVFDEVVTGFRCHPGGIQALFGVSADLGSYGKVLGGGFPIGAIAGRREFMDALDGGAWQYGDDSIPSVGVTYFAGTFVRHPLALAAAKAVLEHLKREGPELQATLTRSTAAMVDELNAFCREVGAPIVLRSFSSVWKVFFEDQAPLQDLLFAMMRNRGVHILDNFPCFMTTAHSAQDIAVIKSAFKGAVAELQAAEFIASRPVAARSFDALRPPVPGARLGRDADGQPAWFVAHPQTPGKYIKVEIQ